MICIYNETNNAFNLSQVNGNVVRISKSKTYNKNGRDLERKLSILTYSNTLNDSVPNVLRAFEKYTRMKELAVISECPTNLIFSRKDFNPFINNNSRTNKDIYIISLDVRGRRIQNISNNGIFILESYLHGGELTLVASASDDSVTIEIDVLDREKNKLNTYVFGKNNEGQFCLNKYQETVSGEIPEPSFMLKKFRPSKPTYTILTLQKDQEALNKLLREGQHHQITVVSVDKIDDTIKHLLEDNYKAVTLFVNSNNVNTDFVANTYGMLREKLAKSFRVYFELLSNNKVLKVRM